MATELYLYGGVHSFSVEDLLEKMEASSDEEIVLRMNTPGGSVMAGWGLIAKMREHGNVTIKVDGAAMSMGAFMLAFANKVEALDVSKIMIHRADMYAPDEAAQAFLKTVNKDLRAKFASKIDDAKLKEITGLGLKEIFENEKRENVFLSAKEAKAIGLVDKIVKLTSEEAKAFSDKFYNVAAEANKEESINKQKPVTMNVEELKASHPDTYKAILALGKSEGKTENQELTAAWNEFADIDAEAVKKGIESGVAPTMVEVIAFLKKGTAEATTVVEEIEAGAQAAVTTETVVEAVVAENKELAELEAGVDAELGITKKS